jgi:hypothetical protein
VNNSPYDPRRESQRIDGPDGLPIATTLQLRAHRENKTNAFYEAHSNAKLMASAPDLLGAVRLAKQQISDIHADESWAKGTLSVIRAAIAKATGEATA